jgi:flagellar hook protein FlgE
MSLYGVLRTSTSGMSAQSSRISTVAENVANANTNGYKAVRTDFSSVFVDNNITSYNSGSVNANPHRLISNQGTLNATSSVTDLAVQGSGFFVVRDSNGENVMTRAGSFLPNANGDLVNTAGFALLGYPLQPNQPSVVVNGFNGLVPINTSNMGLTAQPSTQGTFSTNLPSTASAVAAANLPSTNTAGAQYTAKSSLVTFGNLGDAVTLDLYYSKTATGSWQVTAYNQADASTAGGFPYSTGPLATTNLSFDPTSGQFTPASATNLTIPVPGGQSLTLDLTGTSQLAAGYSVMTAKVNGNVASVAKLVEIAKDGTVYAAYADGTRQAVFRIPLARVPSPDLMESKSGNVFSATGKSGAISIGFPGEAGAGEISSGVLEQSTADIASEFTDMIDAQRGYTANSKVFQTGADLMDVLLNLKR